MDIRKTARGAWLGMVVGLLVGVMGAAMTAAAEAQPPAPKPEATKESATQGSVATTVGNSSRASAEFPAPRGETKEMKAKRLEHAKRAKAVRAAEHRMDFDRLKELREGEKARREAEKTNKTPQVIPASAPVNEGK